MTNPDLSLLGAIVDTISQVDTWDASSLTDTWDRLTIGLSEEEAKTLPAAVAEVVPLLRFDSERLAYIVELIVAFDLFETIPALMSLVSEGRPGDALLAIAVLAASPGSDPEVASLVRQRAQAADLTAAQLTALAIRLDPAQKVRADREASLRAQMWPGASVPSYLKGGAPVVAIYDAGLTAVSQLAIAGELHRSGAAIRRLPTTWKHDPSPAWLGPSVPIVATSSSIVERLRAVDSRINIGQLVPVSADPDTAERHRLIAAVNERLPSHLRLRTEKVGVPVWESHPLSETAYQAGAFDSRELSFLGAGSRSVLQRLKEELPPKKLIGGWGYWSFNQLVALRTWQYFRAETGNRRLGTDVLHSLLHFAGAEKAQRVGVNSVGQILVEANGVFIDYKTGQEAMPGFVQLDKVFRQFELGGNAVPPLLTPSKHTRVDPQILGGTPALQSARISAKSLALLAKQQWTVQQMAGLYPRVPQAELSDAVVTGNRLLAAA